MGKMSLLFHMVYIFSYLTTSIIADHVFPCKVGWSVLWWKVFDRTLVGDSRKLLKGISLTECRYACLVEKTFQCRSLSFSPKVDKGHCIMYGKTRWQDTLAYQHSQVYSYHEWKCVEERCPDQSANEIKWNVLPYKVITGHNNKRYSGVWNYDECRGLCLSEETFKCRSIEVNIYNGECFLSSMTRDDENTEFTHGNYYYHQVVPCTESTGWSTWTPWSSWGPCSMTCTGGTLSQGSRSRTSRRKCLNPGRMAYPSEGCVDEANRTNTEICYTSRPCPPVHGSWGDFGPWSKCTVTCGNGIEFSKRKCDNPMPMYGGDECLGNSVRIRNCTSAISYCPVNGGWSEFGPWSSCSRTCEAGVMYRIRDCSNPTPQHGGQPCIGSTRQVINCTLVTNCPVNGGWGAFGPWSNCGATCGKVTKQRFRQCDNPKPKFSGSNCEGQPSEIAECIDIGLCPVNGNFSDWSRWSGWSGCNSSLCYHGDGLAFYGTRTRSRRRMCDNPVPMYGGEECVGNKTETIYGICSFVDSCIAVDGGWTEFSAWTRCNVSCGVGVIFRERSCSNPEPRNGGSSCIGSTIERVDCYSGKPCQGVNVFVANGTNTSLSNEQFQPYFIRTLSLIIGLVIVIISVIAAICIYLRCKIRKPPRRSLVLEKIPGILDKYDTDEQNKYNNTKLVLNPYAEKKRVENLRKSFRIEDIDLKEFSTEEREQLCAGLLELPEDVGRHRETNLSRPNSFCGDSSPTTNRHCEIAEPDVVLSASHLHTKVKSKQPMMSTAISNVL
ncbi:unnamed protein product [Owenia fusiformis]|uniref:Uncharacterized protein n=1 Tax=Owenia fusiformis TaxID=6347 RepID=A0A8J1TRN5_OWEFU|nr:unnamed protein product [Owenia fusiformis]